MDLTVKAKLALADGSMDLSVNRTSSQLLDSCIEKTEPDSDDDNEDDTSSSMTSGSDSDDLEMDLSVQKSDRKLRVLRHRTIGGGDNDDSDFRLSSCSDAEADVIKHEPDYSVMDLRVNANATSVDGSERVKDNDSSSEEDESPERKPVADVGTAESNETELQLSTEAQFQRELQLFSEKQFPIQFTFPKVEGDDCKVDSAATTGDAKPRQESEGGGDAFLNVADFLELETKITGEASVDTHATEVTFTCTACDLSFSSTLYLTQHIKHCRKLKANCLKPPAAVVLAENGSKVVTETTGAGGRNKGSVISRDVISNCTYRSNPSARKKKKKPGYVLATCNLCSKDLRNHRSLKQHMFLHRLEAGERPFACADCPAAFTQNCDLTKHKRQHTGEKPYACEACDARFTLVSNLSKHRKKHTGEKPHVCPQCGATFAESGSLTRHARQHSGERPYACADCGATFGQSSSLTRHRRKHTGERPYACDVCDARFTESGNLSSHRRLHTGEKPYACPRCGQGHARLSYLKNHARNCRT